MEVGLRFLPIHHSTHLSLGTMPFIVDYLWLMTSQAWLAFCPSRMTLPWPSPLTSLSYTAWLALTTSLHRLTSQACTAWLAFCPHPYDECERVPPYPYATLGPPPVRSGKVGCSPHSAEPFSFLGLGWSESICWWNVQWKVVSTFLLLEYRVMKRKL